MPKEKHRMQMGNIDDNAMQRSAALNHQTTNPHTTLSNDDEA